MAADPSINGVYVQQYQNGTDITLVYTNTDTNYSEYGTLIDSTDAAHGLGDFNDVPWYSNRTKVKRVVVHDFIEPYDMSAYFATMSSVSQIEGLNNISTEMCDNFRQMFYANTSVISLDLSSWNTRYVNNMADMFYSCSKLASINMSGWNTENVTNMSGMFMLCKALTVLDVSSFNTTNVNDMSVMFGNCTKLTTIYASYNFTNAYVSDSTHMFNKDTLLVGGNGTVYDAEHTDAGYAVIDSQYEIGYFTLKKEYLPIQLDEIEIESVYFNGLSVDGVYFNGVQVFKKSSGNIQDS